MESRLAQAFRRLRWRTRRQALLTGAGWGMISWLALASLLSGAARLWPLWERASLFAFLLRLLPLGLAGGALLSACWPRPTRRWLLTWDARLDLAERLTTAWEIAHQQITPPLAMAEAQLQDTLQALEQADLRGAFPLRLSRRVWGMMAVLVALLLPLALAPNPQEAELARRAALRQAAETQAAQLAATRAQLESVPGLTPAQRAAALQALDEALRTLRDPHSSPEQHQAALQQTEQRLAQLTASARPAAAQTLAQAVPLDAPEIAQPLFEALRQGDIAAAQAYLSALQDPGSQPAMSREETQALGEALISLAEALAAQAPELAQAFRDAGEALKTNSSQVSAALAALQQQLAPLKQAQKAAETLEQAQAQTQDAASALAQAQKPSTSSAQGGASTQEGASTQGGASSGNPDAGQAENPQGSTGNSNGGSTGGSSANSGKSGTGGHNEDSGTGAPYGRTDWERLSVQGGILTVPRARLIGQGQPDPGQPGKSQVTYQAIYTSYSRAAEASLQRQAYPPVLRAYIREYFDSLAP